MSFWLIFGACYLASILVVRRVLSKESRRQLRMTIVFSEVALTAVLLVVFGVWRSWTMIPLGPGPTKEVTDLATPSVMVFVSATVLAVCAFLAERRRK